METIDKEILDVNRGEKVMYAYGTNDEERDEKEINRYFRLTFRFFLVFTFAPN